LTVVRDGCSLPHISHWGILTGSRGDGIKHTPERGRSRRRAD
jgi:hypothetical protein